jgi:dihydroflavonol-4-reductase
LHQAHVVATQRALAGLRAAGVRRVVCVSTSGTIAVGTDPDRIYSEDDPPPHELIARWPYYRSKYYAERAALECNVDGEFEVVVVNPSLLLGPGDHRQSSTLEVRRFLAGSLPALSAGGLSFVDVRDAAAATIAALDKGRAGERYLVSAANMPVTTFFGRLSRLTGKALPWARLPKRPELALVSHWAYRKAVGLLGGQTPIESETVDMGSHFWYCDSSKARRELGFEPRDSQATLRDTVSDILNEGRA